MEEYSKEKKLRLLCLHGHNSNNDITQLQILGLRLQEVADCHFLNGPYKGEPSPGLQVFSAGPWYTWCPKSSASFEKDWKKSLDHLQDFVEANGPFDGVYAFSMGVALVTAFLHQRQQDDVCPWKFAILACGGALRLVEDDCRTIRIPSLHIWGEKDSHLKDGHDLATFWDETMRFSYTHKGGHEIDALLLKREPQLAHVLDDFIEQRKEEMTNGQNQIQEKLSAKHDMETGCFSNSCELS